MILTAVIAGAALAICAIYWRVHKNTKDRRGMGKPLPSPGILGSLKAFIYSAALNNMHDFAFEWAQEFGDIFELSVASQRLVFVNSAKLAKRIFSSPGLKDLTNDRPPSFIGKYVVYGDKNIAFTSRSPDQKKRRKIFHGVLKFYGENVCRVESIITHALKSTVEELSGQTEVLITPVIANTVLKIIHILLAGEYSPCSKEKLEALRNFDKMWGRMFVFETETLLSPFPFLRMVPGLPFKKRYDDIIQARTTMEKYYYHQMKENHKQGEERGIIDHLLTAQEGLVAAGDEQTLSGDSIKATICETTVASFITTHNSINTLILFLMLKPEIQNKIHTEIEEVIKSEAPAFRHRHLMPYTEAALLEVLRHSTISPFLIPHYAKEDVNMDGFHIHKDSILLMNAWYCHRRSDLWSDPWTFRPERYLDKNGELLPADGWVRQNSIFFGAGSRQCPGENFARSRMFLIVVTLLQKFEFYPLEGEELPPLDPREWPNGYTCKVPGNYRCGVRERGNAH